MVRVLSSLATSFVTAAAVLDLQKTLRSLAEREQAQCDVPRVDATGMTWEEFKKKGFRGGIVLLTNLFSAADLSNWTEEVFLNRHGNESFYADNTRGNHSRVQLQEYVKRQDPGQMVFVSNSMLGAFGKTMRFALRRPRSKLLRDFLERPLFSVGVEGSSVPKHGDHPETWHALLHGSKAWWLAPRQAGRLPNEDTVLNFRGWEQPCTALRPAKRQVMPHGILFCVQHAGEVLYFGDDVPHADCSLAKFSIAVGAQGHTETWPSLTRASNRGDNQELKKLLSKNTHQGRLDEAAGRYAHTALHRAAIHGHLAAVKQLVAAGANVNVRDADGLPPILLGAFSGHLSIVSYLASFGDGLQAVDGKGAGVMQWAVSQGHTELVTHLADNLDVPVTSRDATGGGGISSAATIGHAAMLESLIYRKADIEEADDNGAKPIHWAAYHGHTAAVRVLLSSRASAVSPDARGHTPLDLAMAASHADVVRQLVHEASVAPHSAIRPKKSKEL